MQPLHEGASSPDFWRGSYRGRPIAILCRYGRWSVYLDHVLQHNVVFGTAEDAMIWLTGRVDNRGQRVLH